MGIVLLLKKKKHPGDKGLLIAKLNNRESIEWPLTRKYILDAGRELFNGNHMTWSYDPSVADARDYGCRLDIKAIVEQGFKEAHDEEKRLQAAVLRKLIDSASRDFLKSLSMAEAALLELTKKELDLYVSRLSDSGYDCIKERGRVKNPAP